MKNVFRSASEIRRDKEETFLFCVNTSFRGKLPLTCNGISGGRVSFPTTNNSNSEKSIKLRHKVQFLNFPDGKNLSGDELGQIKKLNEFLPRFFNCLNFVGLYKANSRSQIT